MNEIEFWEIVSQSKEGSSGVERQIRKLQKILRKHQPTGVKWFHEHLLHKLWDSWRWDLSEAASIAQGSFSEDGFLYFRAWLISRGQEVYVKVLANPDDLADFVRKNTECEAEEFLYAALNVYQELTEQEMEHDGFDLTLKPQGVQLELLEYPKHYPKLCKKFKFDVSLHSKA